MKMSRYLLLLLLAASVTLSATGCLEQLKTSKTYEQSTSSASPVSEPAVAADSSEPEAESVTSQADDLLPDETENTSTASTAEPVPDEVTSEPVVLAPSWQYAANSKINSGTATLYHAKPSLANGHVICINAGHGTRGGSDVKTLCHPDGTPKVTGGTTESGATEAVAVSSGTEFLDGTAEATITLRLALVTKEKLLGAGYDVLMIRETEDVQLDNVARTVIANNTADCHIALHYDSTDFDKGAYFMSVPSDPAYQAMEPVASHWQQHNALGEAVVGGLAAAGIPIFENGSLEMDLTQTSYSTIPSIDLEVGDRASDYSDATLDTIARGIVAGVESYFA